MLCPIFKQFLKLYFFDSNSSVTPCVHLFNRQTKVFIGMKKGKIYLVLFVLLFTGISQLAAQEKRMTRKEKEAAWRAERMKKRALEEREVAHNDSVAFMQAVNALKNGSWALEASNVTFDNGVTRFVTESTNFVSVNEGQGVVQTAFDNSNISSPNGLGGITLEGQISGAEMRTDNEGNIYLNYAIQSSEISATVSVVITANTNQATATVNPNFSSRQMTMSGYIYPYNSAGIIEGSSGYY